MTEKNTFIELKFPAEPGNKIKLNTATEIPEIDTKGLREFAIVTGGVLAVLFGLFFPWLFERAYPLWPWVVFLISACWGLLAPDTLRPIYKGWMKLALLLGKVTTPIFLSIVFFVVFFPTALIMRLLGKDPMHRKFDNTLSSYRVAPHKSDKNNLEKPF